jgi:hypothetical protein
MQHTLDAAELYETIASALIASEKAIMDVFVAHIRANKPITYADLFGIGIGRRALALSSGFRLMVENRNSLCALPIVRMQLDTSLRLYAGFFVSDHQQFSREVFHGAQINRLKSFDGSIMSDRYLVDEVAKRNPWMVEVYKSTSGYVHFSNRHILEALRSDEGADAQLVVGPTDFDREPKHFLEPMKCVHHLNLIIEFALKDWFARMCSVDGSVVPAGEFWNARQQGPDQSYEDGS